MNVFTNSRHSTIRTAAIFLLLLLSQLMVSSADAQNDCTIPESGPWPPCATGGVTPPSTSSNQATQLTDFGEDGFIDKRFSVAHNGRVYFIQHINLATGGSQRTLWVSDGTPENSTPFPIPDSTSSFSAQSIAICQDDLYVTTDESLWLINSFGYLVKIADKPLHFGIETEGSCYFRGGEPVPMDIISKQSLWRVDGTPRQASQIYEGFTADPTGSFQSLGDFTELSNGRLAFVHAYNAGSSSTNKVLTTDGYSTEQITNGWDILGTLDDVIFIGWPGGKGSCGGWFAHGLDGTDLFAMPAGFPTVRGKIDDHIIFGIQNCATGEFQGLWKTDGTPDGTREIALEEVGYLQYNNSLLSIDSDSTKLLRVEGTADGGYTTTQTDLGATLSDIRNVQIIDDWLYFTGNDGTNGNQLWRIRANGTTQAERLTDINRYGDAFPDSQPRRGVPFEFTVESDSLYFMAHNPNEHEQMWKLSLTGGTPSPTPPQNDDHDDNDSDECVIPPSGPWPPCATGGGGSNTPPQSPPSDECIIPESGPWPPCATGGGGNAPIPPPANSDNDCVIPPSGPWPPCATGGNPPTPNLPDECIIPESGPWPACATGG